MVLLLLVVSPFGLMARTVASDVNDLEKTAGLTGNERREVAKMDDGMKTLIYDCIDESKQMSSINQDKSVRNCINLIKMIYNSHSAKLNDQSGRQNQAASLSRQEILKLCAEFKKSQLGLCEKFAERFAVQIARPPAPAQSAPYSQSASGAAR